MANKRSLKKKLNYICGELFAECAAASYENNSALKVQTDTLLCCIIRTHDEFIRRISHPEPGMKAKRYYQVLLDDFNKQAVEIIDNFQGME